MAEDEKKKKKSVLDYLAEGFMTTQARAQKEITEENEESTKKLKKYQESTSYNKAKKLKSGL